MRIFWKVTVNISVAKYEANIKQITIDSCLVIQELDNIGGKKRWLQKGKTQGCHENISPLDRSIISAVTEIHDSSKRT